MLATILQLLNVYEMLIVIYCLLTWLPNAYNSQLGRLLYKLVDPYLNVFRVIPPIGGISFSPIIALFVLSLIKRGIIVIFSIF